jgi:geranylgeranyl reductase family protein
MRADVLVVGLGPGGSSAAGAAAAAGARTIAVERGAQVGVPVQCAEFVPLPMGKYATAPGVPRQLVTGMTTVLPSGERVASAFRGIMIDRARFDQTLAQRARDAGATALLGTSLESIDARRSTAIVREGDARTEIAFGALVAADGPGSRVAHALGLPRLETVDTRQYRVPLRRAHAHTDVYLSAEYPGGYAWLFPRGEVANLGVGLDTRLAPDLKTPLDALHRALAGEGLVGTEILGRTGGAIPVGGLRERLVVGNALFVGDAAGLTHPITGAGIAAAVISGELAGAAAARGAASGARDALGGYEEEVRDQFQATIDRAVARRRWMLARRASGEAHADALHRRGWIAFPEYFDEPAALELAA